MPYGQAVAACSFLLSLLPADTLSYEPGDKFDSFGLLLIALISPASVNVAPHQQPHHSRRAGCRQGGGVGRGAGRQAAGQAVQAASIMANTPLPTKPLPFINSCGFCAMRCAHCSPCPLSHYYTLSLSLYIFPALSTCLSQPCLPFLVVSFEFCCCCSKSWQRAANMKELGAERERERDRERAERRACCQ